MSDMNDSKVVSDLLWAYKKVAALINDTLLMAADAFDDAASQLRSAAEE